MSSPTFRRTAFSPSGVTRAPALLAVAGLHVVAIAGLLHAGKFVRVPLEPRAIEASLVQTSEPERVEVPLPRVVPELPQVVPVELPAFDIDIPRERAITVAHTPPPAPAPVRAAPDSTPLFVSEIEYVRAPRPQYPLSSRRQREEGVVVIRAVVDGDGLAKDAQVHRSSGHPRLDDAAREAVLAALFKPHTENGIARSVVVLIPIEFALGRHAQRERAKDAGLRADARRSG